MEVIREVLRCNPAAYRDGGRGAAVGGCELEGDGGGVEEGAWAGAGEGGGRGGAGEGLFGAIEVCLRDGATSTSRAANPYSVIYVVLSGMGYGRRVVCIDYL